MNVDLTDAPPPPRIPVETYQQLRTAITTEGAGAAIDHLITELRSANDWNSLFYALLMKKRVELGVSPFPTGPSAELPPHTHEAYEHAIRDAARQIGHLYLEQGDFAKAWSYFRLIGEPEPIRSALEAFQPDDGIDIYPLIEIAWQNGVLPEKGFDLVLDRHGVCSAITMVSGSDLNQNPKLRDYCVGRLVRALHEQLRERILTDLQSRGHSIPPHSNLTQLLQSHPELFADDAYHIDTSHLSSVVQMATQLPPGEENRLARELCEYGRRLSPGLRGGGEAPFDETYDDYLPFLNAIAGVDVEAALERFREKAVREHEEGATYAAQVFVNLLVRIGREREALAAARQFLLHEDERNLICPGATELARRLGDYDTLITLAQERNDPVQFLASLIAGSGLQPPVRE